MKCFLGISNFLKRSLVFSILSFSSISLHWSLRKAFLSLLSLLWSSGFRWIYLSFLLAFHFSSFLSYICKASSDNQFAFLHFFFLGMVLITTSCTMLQTSVHSSSGILFIRSNPLNHHLHCIIIGIWFRSYLNGLLVSSTFFHLSLNFAIRSWWTEPQSTSGLFFYDCIELLHLWLQRV